MNQHSRLPTFVSPENQAILPGVEPHRLEMPYWTAQVGIFSFQYAHELMLLATNIFRILATR